MTEPRRIDATDPHGSYVVSASAGTGKTYLLVTRMLRLLLAGANPASILAITFTRKAAGEMQTRLYERLQELALCAEEELGARLTALGIADDAALRTRVRTLYQELLLSGWQPRLTTFHSFCQSLLQRFPLEADVPPGFELIESGEDLLEEAFTVLFDEAGGDTSLYRQLNELMDRCGGLHNLQQALRTFVHNREDWWAWTAGQDDPCNWAAAQVATFLEVSDAAEPLPAFVQQHRQGLQAIADGLGRHSQSRYRGYGDILHDLLASAESDPDRLQERLGSVFYDSRGAARNWKPPRKNHKELSQEQWLQLEQTIADLQLAFEHAVEQHRRQRTRDLLDSWYRCGTALLERLQRIKTERRQLDFSDLEWKACQLLNSSDHAHWIQYKLDQKIDHILVDEFQDTNPTQWRLLYPLLEEFAAAEAERDRSVFLVGDPKQSIYGFRRAEPRLFAAAGGFLQQHLGARQTSPVKSWRSSPAVIEFLNLVCSHPQVSSRLPDFSDHDTHRASLSGSVQLLPLVEQDEEDATDDDGYSALRRPLRQAPQEDAEGPWLREGRQIATRIRDLMAAKLAIQDGENIRPLRYSDIMLLIPNRTHVAGFETALREAGIPYLGADRGTLMECQEIRDINALLQFLSTPFDNVALATILRSPLYGWSHQQLNQLAASHLDEKNWFSRLQLLARDEALPWLQQPLQQLHSWLELSGRLPVHDLLDRIFNEARVRECYRRALPPSLRSRAEANFNRLIDLSLDMDAGRYPSLHRFLDYLATLGARDKEAPDEGQTQAEDRLRILTIHGAKGLEAPLVFLADSSSGGGRDAGTWEALTHWPAELPSPQLVAIIPKKELRPQPLLQLLEEQKRRSSEESMNLLYVALTRPRQYLVVSGSSKSGWYELMHSVLQEAGRLEEFCREDDSDMPLPVATIAATTRAAPSPARPLLDWSSIRVGGERRITPSREDATDVETGGDGNARLRGTAIHLLLELMSAGSERPLAEAAERLSVPGDDARLQDWYREAQALLQMPALAAVFDPGHYRSARNEVPVLATGVAGETIYGIIDRLLVRDDGIMIVDYKTHRYQDRQQLPALAARYRQQMLYYRQSIAAMYPDLPVQACLLFTLHGDLVDMDSLDGSNA